MAEDRVPHPREHFTHIKAVLLGTGSVGKSTLATTFKYGGYPGVPARGVEDPFSKDLTVDGIDYCISVWDTHGGEEYNRLRPLSYPSTDVFIVLYSINSIETYAMVQSFIPEALFHVSTAHIVIVGTKSDLHTPESLKDYRFTSMENGDRLFQVSSLNNEGITELFEYIARLKRPSPPKESGCCKCSII